jgi:hypothetical protein
LQARRSAQQLSLLAWKARHQMHDIIEDDTHPGGGHYFTKLMEGRDL